MKRALVMTTDIEIKSGPSPPDSSSVVTKPLANYQSLSISQKRALDLERAREPAVTCPSCDTQVMPVDLLAHIDQRCTGLRQPGPGAKWITWRDAMAISGVTPMRLSRWTRNGHVRFHGERQDRKYLHRDLALKVAHMRGFRRR